MREDFELSNVKVTSGNQMKNLEGRHLVGANRGLKVSIACEVVEERLRFSKQSDIQSKHDKSEKRRAKKEDR